MVPLIYALCAVTSSVCAILLLRSYVESRYRLLLWAGLCFVAFTINNLMMIADKLIFVEEQMLTVRLSISLLAVCFLLYGLIFEE